MIIPSLSNALPPDSYPPSSALFSPSPRPPARIRHSRSGGSSTSKSPGVSLSRIPEGLDSEQLIEDAPFFEQEPQDILVQTPSPKKRTAALPPLTIEGDQSPPRSYRTLLPRRAPTSRPTLRSTRSPTSLHSPTASTPPSSHSSLPSGPINGPLHRPTLYKGIISSFGTAKTVASAFQYEDPQVLEEVWAIYAQEALAADQKMLAVWHRSLDVRLLFSGIFSAILTPFIVESYKLLLLPDGEPIPAFFGKNGYTVRVNAMWFGSLMFSLIAALLSIHYKQWLDGYLVDLELLDSENLRDSCRLRQYRFRGLQRFHIPHFVGFVPILLYTALLFFGIGLIDFLWHLSQGIAIFISVLCAIVVVVHVTTTFVPLFTTRTPFKTPLSSFLGNLWRGVWKGRLADSNLMHLMDEEEARVVAKEGEDLDYESFHWLMKTTKSVEVHQIALRAEAEFQRQRSAKTRGVTSMSTG
ncbi:hypothetical protein HGRIS_006122 [Hohenbuehelia grisea]|uniref:DUF6535 domain-containing protein n=1 Tax=Hohenbuehelia grisea TaxID=104357 RepID=A0ABR3K197_9AGAR